MRRRPLLTAIGLGTLSCAGCLSDAASDESTKTETPTETPTETGDRRYEACSREVIPYDQFPEEVKAEIDTALDSRYEADRVYLQETMNIDESYVAVNDEYYDPVVTVTDGREVLELRHVVPKALPDPRPVRVEQHRDGERTITVKVVAEDGTVLIDETQSLGPGGDVEFGRTRRVGTHEFRVTVTNGDDIEDETTEAARIDESHFEVLVVIAEDEGYLTGAVTDLGICQYDG